MFFFFVASLVLLSFVFKWLTFGIGAAAWFLMSLVVRTHEGSFSSTWTAIVWQVTLSVLYSGMTALFSVGFASQPTIERSWVYATCGFLATYVTLGSNLREREERLADFETYQSPEQHGANVGAGVGLLAGLIAFPIFYNWPSFFLFIPGSATLLSWLFNISRWLWDFWIVKIVLAVAAMGWLLTAGLTAITGGLTLIGLGYSFLRKSLLGDDAS